ncbi:MAG: sulfoxide reductase heme-binding subunit YedZ [Burkholderiaceae bacterium]|nr:sulfoxide reductase heme-binding subunit YedZ [Sulfuritalea sp.]MCF8175726.1 sulfoxide reductase heme-binding subunit YedZ [Burkholderiaceae bacterium]MCF8184105.1 sulfoxide reductase heme-binding subunit YedZ [Polynucleobacter sp.]
MNPALIKSPLFIACLGPLAYYVWGAQVDTLGANPIEVVTRGMGTWALNFLLITLTVTPLRKISGWVWLIRLRRMLGLFVFFYATLHLATYLWFDQFFDWAEILKDILKRPFITVGMICFALLLPLAATSNAFAIRRIGGRRWQNLHRSIYLIGMLAVLHYFWMVKADLSTPLIYAGLLAALLGIRIWWRLQERNRQLAGAYSPKPRRHIISIAVRK